MQNKTEDATSFCRDFRTTEKAGSFCGIICIPKWLRGGGVGRLAATVVSHTRWCCCCATGRPTLAERHSTIRKWVVAPCCCWGERPLLSKESRAEAPDQSRDQKARVEGVARPIILARLRARTPPRVESQFRGGPIKEKAVTVNILQYLQNQ